MNRIALALCIFAGLFYHLQANASGVSIDKIYNPYVNALEHELEFRAINFQDDKNLLDDIQQYKLAYGQSITDDWFVEIYLTGTNPEDDTFSTDGYELEAKWQATEQGEYAFDAGFLFELESEQDADIWEVSTALLLSKELGPVNFTTNVFLIYEHGKYTPTEFETAANFQFVYRLSPAFEPAIEIYRAQDTFGIGPMIMGTERLQAGKKLHWELGVIAGVSEETPDASIKGLLEFEF